MQTKVRAVGNSIGMTLPKEAVTRLGVEKDDDLFIRFNANGDMVISRLDPDFAEQVQSVRRSMKKFGNALNELAKK